MTLITYSVGYLYLHVDGFLFLCIFIFITL